MQEDGTDGAAHAPVAVYAVTTGTQRLARPVEEGRGRAREQAPQRMPAVDAGTHGVDVRLPPAIAYPLFLLVQRRHVAHHG